MDSRFTPFMLIRTSRRYLRRLHVILGNLFVVCAVLVALGVASAAADMPPTPQATPQGKAYMWVVTAHHNAIKQGHKLLTPGLTDSLASNIRTRIRHGDAVRAHRIAA